MGICGGYQMLGKKLYDPDRLESEIGTTDGMNLLDVDVRFEPEKTLVRRSYEPTAENFLFGSGAVLGYEIHSGAIVYNAAKPAFTHESGFDCAVHHTLPIFGTFIHDVFSNPKFTRAFINFLRRRKNLPPISAPLSLARDKMDEIFERLSKILDEQNVF